MEQLHRVPTTHGTSEDPTSMVFDRHRTAMLFGQFEAKRKERVMLFYFGLFATLLLTPFSISWSGDADLPIILFLAGCCLSYAPLEFLRVDFKNRLIPIILRHYNFRYDQYAEEVILDRFAPILPSYNDQKLEDHVGGQHKGVRIDAADLELWSGSGRKKLPVFRGMVAQFDYQKRADTLVVVKSDRSVIGKLLASFCVDGNRVRLEDPEFEKRFDVFSADQVKARYMLTPAVMQRLVVLEKRHPGVRVQFAGDKVFLAIPGARNLFHPGSFITPINPALVEMFQADMESLLEFVEALKLGATTKI